MPILQFLTLCFCGITIFICVLRTGVSDLCQLHLYSYTSIWRYCFIFRWKFIIKFYKILFHSVFSTFIFTNVCCGRGCECLREHMPHVSADFEYQKSESDSNEEILCCLVFKHCPSEFLISHTLFPSYFPMCEIMYFTFIDAFAL